MLLFRSLGSKHNLNDLFFFSTITKLETQSVGSVTIDIIFYFTNESSVSFNLSLIESGTRLAA